MWIRKTSHFRFGNYYSGIPFFIPNNTLAVRAKIPLWQYNQNYLEKTYAELLEVV